MTSAARDPGRVVAVPLLVGLLALNALHLATGGGSGLRRTATAVTVLFYVVLAVQYLRRGAASATDRRPQVWTAAVGATASPFLIPLVGGPAPSPAAVLGGAGMIALGTGLAVWAAWSLGTSISVIPQSRTLASRGPYRWLRHPLYVFELVATAGLCLVTGGGAPWVVLVVLAALQVLRARWEERLLVRTMPGYAEYRARTIGLAPASRT